MPSPVPVYCVESQDEWNAGPFLGFAIAYTYISTREIFLSPDMCRSLRDRKMNSDFGMYSAALYHEYIHSALMDNDEGEAECLSLFAYRYLMEKYWGFTPSQSKRLYRWAWIAHVTRGFAYPAYVGTCKERDSFRSP